MLKHKTVNTDLKLDTQDHSLRVPKRTALRITPLISKQGHSLPQVTAIMENF